jgi:hypothetical protein
MSVESGCLLPSIWLTFEVAIIQDMGFTVTKEDLSEALSYAPSMYYVPICALIHAILARFVGL